MNTELKQELQQSIENFTKEVTDLFQRSTVATLEELVGSFVAQLSEPAPEKVAAPKQEVVVKTQPLGRAALQMKLVEYIGANPQCSGPQIRSALNLGKDYAFAAAMKELVQANKIIAKGQTLKRRYWLAGADTSPKEETFKKVHSGGPPPWKNKIAEFIKANPGKTNVQIRKALNYTASNSTFSRHLSDLSRAGRITQTQTRGKFLYS